MLRGQVVCNGATLCYRRIGAAGSDVVLIHGLATNHAFWRLNVLLSLAREHKVTLYDMRGHGYSSMPREGYTSEDMVRDLDGLLDHLGIHRAHLVGHSMGGVVALQYAISRPERLLSLTVADSRLRTFQPTNYLADWPNWQKAQEKLERLGINVPVDEPEAGIWLLEQIAMPKWHSQRDKLAGSPLGVPFGGWNGGQKTAELWLKLLNETTARADLATTGRMTCEMIATVQQPAMVIYGEHSSTLRSFYGLQGCLPHCTDVLVPNGGHFFPLTQSEIFVNHVKQFLKTTED